MSESKELLEATIKGLEEKVNELNNDLRSKQRELADVNKPEMTNVMFDEITDLVHNAVSDIRLDCDSLEYSLEMNYDNTVELVDVSLNDPSELGETITNYIDDHYKIVGTPADE